MQFKVVGRSAPNNGKSIVYLTWDEWNDFSYRTFYGLVYKDKYGESHYIGGVKIAHIGQERGPHSLEQGVSFSKLESDFFSLGDSDEYYEKLNSLGSLIRDEILIALNDIAKSPRYYDIAINEDVTQTSLLRYISPRTVTGQYRRICGGGARLTSYNFTFIPAPKKHSIGFELSFAVKPESRPPTNIHIIIGRNGVGKTHLLNEMITSLVDRNTDTNLSGQFVIEDEEEEENEFFVNVVSVSFSAFDETKPKVEQTDKTHGILYYYIGLRRITTGDDMDSTPKSTDMLCSEFLNSLNVCKRNPQKELWTKAIKTLESDPNFESSRVRDLIDIPSIMDEREVDEYRKIGTEIFRTLSSGHKIILLTITRLIETVQEKTLILIDEPEAHLHPPLLAAFIRALSDLLTATNGVAIIATHSPVVLQEVPRNCVWKLRNSGESTIAERLSIESFGENVGILTGEVFSLEVTASGFYKILVDHVTQGKSYEEIIKYFGGNLGMEAKGILMALIAERNSY